MDQLALFDARLIGTARDAGRMRLDTGSERLLATYRAVRLAEGANASSVAREVSQLRGVAREAGTPDEPAALRMLCADLTLVAEVLREPRSAIARSTGRTRLLAVQRFIRVMARRLGRDSDTDLVTLDALLPARRSTGWHTTGTLVAGAAGRRRRRAPTLSTPDLRCIVDAAGDS